ncbi:MAG TPA: hypothetical protein PLZ32_01530 [Saprospiraceae bacterium]|nr:hypothetical protein [Saprospiraceae bacterium]
MTVKSKAKQTNIKYNPALDKFNDKDLFPSKTQAAREHLSGRDIKKELEDIRVKERLTKP